jgi:hypothetical protein
MLVSTMPPINQILNVKQKLLDGFVARRQERDSIHVSDLTHCRRRICFERLDENPPSIPDERKIKYFMSGEIKHLYLQELLGDEFECEKEVVWTSSKGIAVIAHPNAIHKDTGVVVEFKTTESIHVTKEPYVHHIKQLKNYMAIKNTSYGKLLYVILGSTREVKDYFPEYLVTFEPGEREKVLQDLEADAAELRYGIDSRNPGLVGHIAKDKMYFNSRNENRLCKDCPFRNRCIKYRRDSGEFKNRIEELLAGL